VRIVLDTNVLISGLLSPFGPPGEIVRMVSSGELTLCLDARILAEYRDVLLRPKFGFHGDAVAALLHFVEHRGHTVASSPLPEHLPNPSDEPFLEVARACGAECLVTGNLAHFPTPLRQGVAVFSPGEFMSAYRMR
jgi:putative PIN family toxin of toxin-antitoxin system